MEKREKTELSPFPKTYWAAATAINPWSASSVVTGRSKAKAAKPSDVANTNGIGIHIRPPSMYDLNAAFGFAAMALCKIDSAKCFSHEYVKVDANKSDIVLVVYTRLK